MESLYLPQIQINVSFDRQTKTTELYKITSSFSASDILRKIFNADTFYWQEEFMLLCLNNANKVIGYYKLSSGGITGTVVDVRMIYTIAVKCGAVGIVIAHNHPSGTNHPSESDKAITTKIKKAGETLDIKLIDHIILTDENFYSFTDNGLI